MKKIVLSFFSCLLVLTLLLGSFSSAKAEFGDDPVVTPVSGDMEFTTEVVAIAALPGTMELASLMLAPVGFPAGEAQFGGNGIRVKGMDSGKANVCFTLSTVAVNQGWGGKVGVWDGKKWVVLPTTIKTTGDDGTSTSACATITGNGTYAFIQYVTEPDKLPDTAYCNGPVQIFPLFFPGDGPGPVFVPQIIEQPSLRFRLIAFIIMSSPVIPVGSTISYQVTSSDPAGLILSGAFNSGPVIANDPNNTYSVVAFGDYDGFNIPSGVTITIDPDLADEFTGLDVQINLPGCHVDLTFPEDFSPFIPLP